MPQTTRRKNYRKNLIKLHLFSLFTYFSFAAFLFFSFFFFLYLFNHSHQTLSLHSLLCLCSVREITAIERTFRFFLSFLFFCASSFKRLCRFSALHRTLFLTLCLHFAFPLGVLCTLCCLPRCVVSEFCGVHPIQKQRRMSLLRQLVLYRIEWRVSRNVSVHRTGFFLPFYRSKDSL